MQEPTPQPRKTDVLMAQYIRIGGFMGVGLATVVFFLICGFGYYMFFAASFGHGYMLLGIILILVTLLLAAAAAVSVFFWASVMWLPILIGIVILLIFAMPLWEKMRHY